MSEDPAQEMLALQRETNRWLRIIALPSLAAVLEKALETQEERRLYQASDGRTSREVGAEAGVSHPTVLRAWNRWARAGIVEQVSSGRYSRIISLEEVGLIES